MGLLVFDHDVSKQSPVVQGTWVTVDEVVSAALTGLGWQELRFQFPELDENDILECFTYTLGKREHDAH